MPDRHSDLTADELAAVTRTVDRLLNRWQLTPAQAAFIRAGDDPVRLGDLLRIHAGTRILYTELDRAYGWMRRPSSIFGGQAPLDIMLNETGGVERVLLYLQAETELELVLEDHREAFQTLASR